MAMASSNFPPSSPLSLHGQQTLIKKLQIFQIQGTDKRGRPILLVIGKLYPARLVSVEALKKHMEEEIFPRLAGRAFSVVYVHTAVNRGENFPGISALKSIYEAIPGEVRENLDRLYFVHPGIQSRLFLATLGRLLFSGGGGLYGKVKYVNRLEFLWENIKRKGGIEIPEFVYDFDEELEEDSPTMDYGLESDHPGALDSTVSTYSMRVFSKREQSPYGSRLSGLGSRVRFSNREFFFSIRKFVLQSGVSLLHSGVCPPIGSFFSPFGSIRVPVQRAMEGKEDATGIG